jgi:hypothetical protein
MSKSRDVAASNPFVARGIDRLLTVQRPAVLSHIRSIRRGHPTAGPAELIRILERRFLLAVTTGGAVVGATSIIPAVGTGASLALSGVETAGFLEASALFAQSVTEVHGIVVDDPDRARALVMAMVLGTAGSDLVKQLAGQATGKAPTRTSFWGEMITKSLPRTVVGPIADQMKKTFIKRFAVAQGTNAAGRLIPFGIGAVIGGGGNHLLGRQIVKSSREAFGAPPVMVPSWLEPVIRQPKAPKTPKALKPPKAPKAMKSPKAAKAPKALSAKKQDALAEPRKKPEHREDSQRREIRIRLPNFTIPSIPSIRIVRPAPKKVEESEHATVSPGSVVVVRAVEAPKEPDSIK